MNKQIREKLKEFAQRVCRQREVLRERLVRREGHLGAQSQTLSQKYEGKE